MKSTRFMMKEIADALGLPIVDFGTTAQWEAEVESFTFTDDVRTTRRAFVALSERARNRIAGTREFRDWMRAHRDELLGMINGQPHR